LYSLMAKLYPNWKTVSRFAICYACAGVKPQRAQLADGTEVLILGEWLNEKGEIEYYRTNK